MSFYRNAGGDMDKFVQFIEGNYDGFLATTVLNQPRVRPFHFMYYENNRFYFCTNNSKEIFKELEINPFIEFCSKNDSFGWIRLRGAVVFTDEISVKQKIISASDIVRKIYQTANNPSLVAFYIEHGEILLSEGLNSPASYFDF